MEIKAPNYVEIMCGKGGVRKKIVGKESQSPVGELAGGKQESILEIILLHLKKPVWWEFRTLPH